MKTPPVSLTDLATAHLASVPFNAWLGVELLLAEADAVELRVPWRPEFGGAPGMIHGGILASLIDTTAFLVLVTHQGAGGPTIDMRIDYHRSTWGRPLHLRGSLIRSGATISNVDVQILDEDEHLIATGRCVFLSQPRRRLPATLQESTESP